MDIRSSFYRLKKRVKHLGGKQKLGGAGADVDGESVGSDNPLPQPEPYVVADDGEEDGTDEGGQQAGPMYQPPQSGEPKLLLANGGENDQEVGVVDIDGRKVSPMHSHPHSDIEVRVGSRPHLGRDGDDGEENVEVYPRASSPLVLYSGESDGVLTPQYCRDECPTECCYRWDHIKQGVYCRSYGQITPCGEKLGKWLWSTQVHC